MINKRANILYTSNFPPGTSIGDILTESSTAAANPNSPHPHHPPHPASDGFSSSPLAKELSRELNRVPLAPMSTFIGANNNADNNNHHNKTGAGVSGTHNSNSNNHISNHSNHNNINHSGPASPHAGIKNTNNRHAIVGVGVGVGVSGVGVPYGVIVSTGSAPCHPAANGLGLGHHHYHPGGGGGDGGIFHSTLNPLYHLSNGSKLLLQCG